LAWLIFAARIRWPSRDDAIRRIEAVSGIPHRPATSYEDSLTASAEDPTTQAIWAAHRQRMADLIKRLRPGRPSPRTHRFDPLALRALAVLGVVLGVALAGRAGLDNLMDAFRIDSRTAIADQRLDAWVTPPAYTGRAPVMLVDGSTMAGSAAASTPESADVIEVPENSSLIVRASGPTRIPLTLEVWLPGAAEPMEKIDSAPEEGPAAGVTEVRTELESSATIKVHSNGHQLASWPITIILDNIPGIALTRNPERTTRGALKLTYFVQDDYGVASAEVRFARIRDAEKGDPATAWARGKELKGPRPPFSRPPQLSLRLPSPNAKQGEAFTYHEIGSHPWAGQKVMMTLEAKDVAGQIGRSPSMEIVLPERPFTKPLARALIEQRKLLIEDPRYADRVRTIEAARAVGLEICAGGIIGLGESVAQRLELGLELRRLGVDSVALNVLNPIPGTPLENVPPVPALEVLKTIAVFRLLMPGTEIRTCGGRERALRGLQPMMYLAGASGTMIGDYLTTAGRDAGQDLTDVQDLGLLVAEI